MYLKYLPCGLENYEHQGHSGNETVTLHKYDSAADCSVELRLTLVFLAAVLGPHQHIHCSMLAFPVTSSEYHFWNLVILDEGWNVWLLGYFFLGDLIRSAQRLNGGAWPLGPCTLTM